MVVLGLIASHLVLQIVLMTRNSLVRWLLISGYLKELDGCTYTTFKVRDYFEQETENYEDIDKWFIKSMFRMIGLPNASIDHLVHIHVASGPRRSWNLAAYPLPLFESHLFVHEGPPTATGIQKFLLLHEIGHFVMKPINSEFGLTPFIFLLGWISLTGAWNSTMLITTACYVLAIALWREGTRHSLASVALADELLADAFALGYLGKETLLKMAGNKYLFSYLNDNNLNPTSNSIRLSKLRRDIDRRLAGNDDDMIQETLAMVPRPTLIAVVATILLVGLTGTVATAPSPRTLFWFLILDVVLLAVFLFMLMLALGMEQVVQDRIAEPLP
jgi:hypothetical protein